MFNRCSVFPNYVCMGDCATNCIRALDGQRDQHGEPSYYDGLTKAKKAQDRQEGQKNGSSGQERK